MWQCDLDRIEIVVPGRASLKYIPKNVLDNLQLRNLGYNEEILLVRKEYTTVLKKLNKRPDNGGGIVITGQPGIGTI